MVSYFGCTLKYLQQTMKAIPSSNGYATFCVSDLSSHPDLRRLPFVEGAPGFKYYAGTPLITLGGLYIGILYVMDIDTKPKDLTQVEVNFLGVMASNVMKYLEMQRENAQRKRSTIMSKGLAAFVEGRRRIPADWESTETASTGTSNSHARSLDIVHNDERRGSRNSESASSADGEVGSPDDADEYRQPNSRPKRATDLMGRHGSIHESEADADMDMHEAVLARASNLLRESLDVDFTVFFDTNSDARHVATELNSQNSRSCTDIPLDSCTDDSTRWNNGGGGLWQTGNAEIGYRKTPGG